MSEHLTHIAVYEDCARMILNSKRFCEAFKTCVKNHYHTGMMTSGSRNGTAWTVPIFEKYKDGWVQGQQDHDIQVQISGAIGWLAHRASDLQMKPVWHAEVEKNQDFKDYEMQIYLDGLAFREIFEGGKQGTESPYELITPATLEEGMVSHPASNSINVHQVETLLTYSWQREFIEMQQFYSDKEDVEAWLDKFLLNYPPFVEPLGTYFEAFSNPNPVKMDQYINGFNIYDSEDDIIQFVRNIQHNRPNDHIDLETAVKKAENQSHYAQSLRKGYNFLASASDYFTGNLEKDKLYDVLEVKERSRK